MKKPDHKSRLLTSLLVGLIAFCANLEAIAGPATTTPPYRITATKAMLFYDGSGAFSRDVLAKPDFSFWNTITGEGMQKVHRIRPWS